MSVACTELRRPLGEDCLKDDDCLSGLCSALKCAATPPVLDGSPERADAGASDATADDGGDSAVPADAGSSDVVEGG